MRHSSRPSVRLGIKAFDQRHQLRRLRIPEVPLEAGIRSHRVRLAHPVRVDEFGRDEVIVRDGVRVCDGQRVLENSPDRPPDVDDLVPALEEFGGFVGEVVRDAVFAGGVGLVDVDALDGTAELGGNTAFVSWLAADCMVEDEDFGCAGAGCSVSIVPEGGCSHTHASLSNCSTSG